MNTIQKSHLSLRYLTTILVFAIISVFFLFGCNSLPAVSSLFATSTPTITATSTPTLTPTVTPTHTPSPTPTATPDQRVLNPANQHLYLYVKIEKNWHQARDYCALQGGHLVTIQDAAENMFIYKLGSGNTWLGATDEVNEGTWVWASGEPWKYTTWREGEPNNYQIEHYLTYHPEKLSFWNDTGNGNMYFVCEWESASP
jgi:hypothetical protein